jgi:hypothetical protein
MPSQDDAPMQRDRRGNGPHHAEDRGGAVRRSRVVELWARGKIVCLFDIFDEQRTRALRRGREPIELDLLVTDLAQGHQVTLIGSDVDQLVRLEKARDCRVLVILRPSQLDGKIEIAPIFETKAHNRVRDRGPPSNKQETDRAIAIS